MEDDKPLDAFDAHEVLHTASIIAIFFENTIERHRFTQSNPTIRAAAESLSAELHDFYQLVGRETGGEARVARSASRDTVTSASNDDEG
jgi:hypothetical protein